MSSAALPGRHSAPALLRASSTTTGVLEERVVSFELVPDQRFGALEGSDRVRGSSEGESSVPERAADVALEGSPHLVVASFEQLGEDLLRLGRPPCGGQSRAPLSALDDRVVEGPPQICS